MAEKKVAHVPRGYASDRKFLELASGLTPRQIKFALAYAESPNLPQHELAKRAGFAEKSARTSGFQNMHNEKVRALIRYLVEAKMATLPAVFPTTIEAIAAGEFDANTRAGELRLKAAKAAAAHGGMQPVVRIEKHEEKTVRHVLTIDQALGRLRAAGVKLRGDTIEHEPYPLPRIQDHRNDD